MLVVLTLMKILSLFVCVYVPLLLTHRPVVIFLLVTSIFAPSQIDMILLLIVWHHTVLCWLIYALWMTKRLITYVSDCHATTPWIDHVVINHNLCNYQYVSQLWTDLF